jgi:hypothetical protein
VHDESANGYGAIVPNQDNGWLRVGCLIATHTREAGHWRLGAIRRLTRMNEDNTSVGIEIFDATPQLATLNSLGTHEDYIVDGRNHAQALSSLWLDAADGKPSIILDPAHFHSKKEFEVHGIAGASKIRLGHPLERSEGWIRVQIDLLKS